MLRKPITTFTPQDVCFLRNANIEADSICQEELERIERENRKILYELGPRAVDRILDDIMALPPRKPVRAQVEDVDEVQWDALVATIKHRDAAIAAARRWKRTSVLTWGCAAIVMLAGAWCWFAGVL